MLTWFWFFVGGGCVDCCMLSGGSGVVSVVHRLGLSLCRTRRICRTDCTAPCVANNQPCRINLSFFPRLFSVSSSQGNDVHAMRATHVTDHVLSPVASPAGGLVPPFTMQLRRLECVCTYLFPYQFKRSCQSFAFIPVLPLTTHYPFDSFEYTGAQ